MAEKQIVERVDPDPSVVTFGVSGTPDILNKRSDRVYQLGNPNDPLFGVPALLANGWRFINRNSDKERVMGGGAGRDNSDHETWKDQILMYAPRASYEAFQAHKEEKQKTFLAQRDSAGGVDSVRDTRGELAQKF